MATNRTRRPAAPPVVPPTFTQTVFAKKYEGVEERGICVRQRFYLLHGVNVGDKVMLREPPKPKMSGALYEMSFDAGQTWRPLPHSYRNI